MRLKLPDDSRTLLSGLIAAIQLTISKFMTPCTSTLSTYFVGQSCELVLVQQEALKVREHSHRTRETLELVVVGVEHLEKLQ